MTRTPTTDQPQATPASSPPPAQATTSGRFIVLFGTKGGVGKTMVAINLAVSLAQRTKQSICLLDLDIMAVGDVAKVLNLSVSRFVVELMPLMRGEEAAATSPATPKPYTGLLSLDGLAVHHSAGVDVIECIENPRQASQLRPQLLPPLFEELKRRYAYVIVDGGRAFSESLIAAFDAANLILLVVTPDVLTLYQTRWAVNMVEHLLFPSIMVKAILNRADSHGSIRTEDSQAAIPCEVIGHLPSAGRVVGSSLNQGIPLAVGFPHTPVAEAFKRLADVLVTRADLYLSHQEIPRHRRAQVEEAVTAATPALWSARLFAGEEPTPITEAIDEVALMKQRIHSRLVDELDLKRLDVGVRSDTVRMAELRKRIEPVVANLLAREMGGLVASQEVRAQLVREVVDEALGLGPLEELLADPEVTDILVNSKDQIYVERHGRLELTSKKFISNEQVRTIIERIVAPLGRRIDEANPMVDARLPDGSRINAIIPPLSIKGPMISIRKFARTRYTADDLIRMGTLTEAMATFLKACVIARKNILISGGTGSGKTTFLNMVSTWIPPWERILTIEDAAELKLAQRHWVSLEARLPNIEGKGQVTIRDLFRNALRMRPDRIIIGECRGGETLDMLQAMNTGHDGSLTTVHANSPKDVIARLDSMVLMSNVELPVRTIREMVTSAIHLIIHTARLSSGERKVVAISEIVGLAGEEVRFQDVFLFRQRGVAAEGHVIGAFVATGHRPTFLEELHAKGVPVEARLFERTDEAPG